MYCLHGYKSTPVLLIGLWLFWVAMQTNLYSTNIYVHYVWIRVNKFLILPRIVCLTEPRIPPKLFWQMQTTIGICISSGCFMWLSLRVRLFVRHFGTLFFSGQFEGVTMIWYISGALEGCPSSFIFKKRLDLLARQKWRQSFKSWL